MQKRLHELRGESKIRGCIFGENWSKERRSHVATAENKAGVEAGRRSRSPESGNHDRDSLRPDFLLEDLGSRGLRRWVWSDWDRDAHGHSRRNRHRNGLRIDSPRWDYWRYHHRNHHVLLPVADDRTHAARSVESAAPATSTVRPERRAPMLSGKTNFIQIQSPHARNRMATIVVTSSFRAAVPGFGRYAESDVPIDLRKPPGHSARYRLRPDRTRCAASSSPGK